MAQSKCSESDCLNLTHARGLCAKHYRRDRAATKGLFCIREACDKLVWADGLCRAHYDRRRRADDLQDLRNRRSCSVDGCDRPWICGQYCALHDRRVRKTGEPGPAHILIAAKGSGSVTRAGYHETQVAGRRIGTHRLVMAQVLGRDLEPFENVHHINGVRDDNRPENLELWVETQPTGQRVEDLVSWVVDHYPEIARAKLDERI